MWKSEFDNIVSKRDKLQDSTINQLKIEVYNTYKKDRKITANLEPSNPEDVINKAYLDEKSIKLNGHLSLLEKDYNEFKLQYKKQSVEKFLIQRAFKTKIQALYDKDLFDNQAIADKVKEEFLITTRRRPVLEEVNDIIQWFFFQKYNLKSRATSNIKIQQVLDFTGLHNVGIYLRDGQFSSDIGTVSLHWSKGTHWICYINEKYFDSYGFAPPQKLSKYIIKRRGHCLYSEYKIQGLTNKRNYFVQVIVFI